MSLFFTTSADIIIQCHEADSVGEKPLDMCEQSKNEN